MPLSWQDRLDFASTGADVVVIAQDFVAQFSEEEIAELPVVCRPGNFLVANDVTAYSFQVVRHHRAGNAETAARVHSLASFSFDASIRLSQLTGLPRAAAPASADPIVVKVAPVKPN
jgi:hypothetical protein